MAAACSEVDAERGDGDADSPRMAESPLPFEEVMMRGRADGDDGGSELRSGAILTSRIDKVWQIWQIRKCCRSRLQRNNLGPGFQVPRLVYLSCQLPVTSYQPPVTGHQLPAQSPVKLRAKQAVFEAN